MKPSFLIFCLLFAFVATASPADSDTEVKVADGKLRVVIEGLPEGKAGDQDKVIFSTQVQQSIKVARDKLTYQFAVTLDILHGQPKELALAISGEGEIKQVTGDALQDWSIRQDPEGARTLILRPQEGDEPLTQLSVIVTGERELKSWKNPIAPLTLTPPEPAPFRGFVKVESAPELDVQAEDPKGLAPLEAKYLPDDFRGKMKPGEPAPLAFQFHGSAYTLPLKITVADPEARHVALHDFKLIGALTEQNAAFTLTATAHVANPKGGSLTLLSGRLALTELPRHPDWRVISNQGRFTLVFDKPGDFPLEFKFHAGVQQSAGWNAVDFRVARSALQPILLLGLAADTQFQFEGAARPERVGHDFASFLPPDGAVKLSWKTAAPEAGGKLFYAAEMLAQISVGPGLMQQAALLDGKVMQGELDRVTLLLRGAGEVTRVQGAQVLAWRVEPGANAEERRLIVQFNQPQKNQFALQIQTQTPIGAFPQSVEAMQLRPEGVTRFSGYVRIVNEGAVRLEVTPARGLSQVSPEQFPESGATKSAFRPGGQQRFVYRFSGADFALRIQADQILPELTVSELLAYHFGENEQSIDAEIELDVREAPLRELLVHVPKGYAVAKLAVAGLSDYFLRDADADAELRLVYAQPVSDRQVLQFRLERNQALGAADWKLPRIDVEKAKAVRGNVAVSADAGLRLTTERTQALTEMATAFFPRKVAGIQGAFRLSEPAWQATVRIERLPQSIQVDALHLFSIGEGVAYGSSVLNYAISGAPIAAFRVELSGEYFNVEFTGKDIRNWEKAEGGYVVQLHTPVAGAYTLLATYERPFKAQGETLAFTGARPLDAQSEQGHTLVTSAYQFQVKPVDVSPGLLPLETIEAPPEYRLFFDAPILAAYRYAARPFNLKLALSPLAQGDSVSQVVDRASLTTRISKEGQALTDAHYFVKNRGHANLRLTLPEGSELWSATVNGAAVAPVKDDKSDLIPLPQQADPNAVLAIDLKLATRADNPQRVTVATPIVDAPVMLAEWKLEPDTAYRLVYREGSIAPADGAADVSGFAQLTRTFSGAEAPGAAVVLFVSLALIGLAAVVWRSAARQDVFKFTARHSSAIVLGCIAFALAGAGLLRLSDLTSEHTAELPRDLTFLAPVQQAGNSLSVQVGNIEEKVSPFDWMGRAWPAFLALTVFASSWKARKSLWRIIGWTLLTWAALRCPSGAGAFLVVVEAFFVLEVAAPALLRLWQSPRKPKPATPPRGGAAGASAAVVLALFTLFVHGARAGDAAGLPPKESPIAETATQQIRVEEKFALATARVHWQALKGQRLPLLFEPAVLTNITYPAAALKLVEASSGTKHAQELLALETGPFDVEFQYQAPVTKKDADNGFALPAQFGLVNRVTITLANLDVDIVSPQAVSIERKLVGKDTIATLVLAPVNDVWIGWKPRSRDVAREKAVFYAELTQLYAPVAGVIEGLHSASIRPAQGELSEMAFAVPKDATITDVSPLNFAPGHDKAPPVVSQWRFDPDTGKLRVNLTPPQSHPFTLLIRSQIATGSLPVARPVGLLSVENSAGQIGVLGIATGNEVQLDAVTAETLAPINLEDFPGNMTPVLAAQIPGLTVRRAFRYADARATALLKASAVEPDVRVESQDTLSLGEDRALLAVESTVDITRAGIFRLSFALPAGMDVESISGQSLSHWTESNTGAGRIITMHLRGRTEGRQQFAITLAGPGMKAAKAWTAPQVIFREASKQHGTFLVAPEQGMRLQVAARDGLTQLDPQKSGIKQKGVLAFRVLQTPWKLALDVEQVDPWVQVTSLQHAAVGEAQVKVTANLQYQIENTGLKSFHVSAPANAENVRFTGDQVADFLPAPDGAKDGLQSWEVKLHRRVIGQYHLQVTYQTPVGANAVETSLRGVQATDINLQRGFVTVQSGGRLQVRVDAPPAALQPVEWQSIPRALLQDLAASSVSFAYRLVEPAFTLPMKLERHEAAKLLPARVNSITFTSAISDSGAMLTQARLEILPGDKRLLHLSLPKDGKFWFAFVNENGVWPWREGGEILIPLEQHTRAGKAIQVEVFFSSQIGEAGARELDLQLLAPKFDLPLENITWRVFLGEKWQLKKWTGSLQLRTDEIAPRAAAVDVQSYLQSEAAQQRDKTRAAEEMLARGNSALASGNPQEARRAFESAFELSQHDNAFNEDARVQLHNLKLQQALVGLNVRQSSSAGEPNAIAGKLRAGRGGKDANYTQQDARQILDSNTADENAAFTRLAERLIQQQDAAVSTPAAIQASIPEQGRLLTFTRAVAVDSFADLQIGLEAKAISAASWSTRFLILTGTMLILALFSPFLPPLRRKQPAPTQP